MPPCRLHGIGEARETAVQTTRIPRPALDVWQSSGLRQGDGAPHRIDTALVSAVCRSRMPRDVIAREEQARVSVVFRGLQFLEQKFMIDAHGQGGITALDSRIVVP